MGRLRVEMERVIDRPPFVPMDFPVFINSSGDGSGRQYVAFQFGDIGSVLNNTWSTFLDLRSETISSGPRGLLGTAFHPGYSDPLSPGHRKFYTFHTVPIPGTPVTIDFDPPGTAIHHSLVTEWKVCDTNENPSCTPGAIDVSTRREVFRHAHGDDEHSGGMLEFGPDGYLYGVIGVPRLSSDAGISTSQIRLQSQDLTSMHGKYFRIDPVHPSLTPSSLDAISANGKYRIPTDNPFVNTPGAIDEIYAYGARNPYRFSIDPVSGILFSGDVGDGAREELNAVPAGGNMGYPYREGTIQGSVSGGVGPFVEPLGDYTHSDGRSAIGGYIYRGSIPLLQGKYIFGEFSWGTGPQNDTSGRLLWMDPFDEMGELKDPSELSIQEIARGEDSCALSFHSLCTLDITLYSFGIDDDGELYAIGFEKWTNPDKMVAYKITDAYFIPEGDYDEDRTVDDADQLVWQAAYGTLPGGTQVRRGYGADGNRDGLINAADYVLWSKMLGQSTGSGGLSNVPEPSTLLAGIVALVMTAVATRSTRRQSVVS
jgi:hypothetical protein